ncbi:peptidase M20 [Kaistia algarum]|uniref:M20 family metallopeptidase n=1 Tax=Kaistia algarum TaxID=2083279 RepID=UPI000CE91B93|nr:M20 family metallopeptidase [Kaistia algarum]MCX5515015.1 M20 family metallopeptidase [Kaistia algarum]PPE79757.1 peptidase M20 [Kaistia algarum]
MIDPVLLTRDLVRIDTRNPPGHEAAATTLLADTLSDAGFSVRVQSFGEGRTNLVARIGDEGPATLFTGHVDTVPLGTVDWSVDPFGGEIRDGRIYGRGTTDMKAGVAAMVAAAIAEADRIRERGALVLAFTGGEETGSEGAQYLVAEGKLGEISAIVVGEPTANRFLAGHKGALWLRCGCRGVTAHGSTPHLGDNAIYKAARSVLRLETFDFGIDDHPIMGKPTLNIGTISGGQNINSVPDRAEFTVDIRSIPGLVHESVRGEVQAKAGAETAIETIIDLPSVWSDPAGAIMAKMAAAVSSATGRPTEAASANYFTDASVFTPALGFPPTLICGPGDPDMAHKTDEYCETVRIAESVAIYRTILAGL